MKRFGLYFNRSCDSLYLSDVLKFEDAMSLIDIPFGGRNIVNTILLDGKMMPITPRDRSSPYLKLLEDVLDDEFYVSHEDSLVTLSDLKVGREYQTIITGKFMKRFLEERCKSFKRIRVKTLILFWLKKGVFKDWTTAIAEGCSNVKNLLSVLAKTFYEVPEIYGFYSRPIYHMYTVVSIGTDTYLVFVKPDGDFKISKLAEMENQ